MQKGSHVGDVSMRRKMVRPKPHGQFRSRLASAIRFGDKVTEKHQGMYIKRAPIVVA